MIENTPAPEGATEITEDMKEPVEELDEALVDAGLAQEARPAETVVEKAKEAPDTADEAVEEILKGDAATPEQAKETADDAVAEAKEEAEKIAT